MAPGLTVACLLAGVALLPACGGDAEPERAEKAPAGPAPRLLERIHAGNLIEGLEYAHGSVWAGDHRLGRILQVDPRTRRVAGTIPVNPQENPQAAIQVGLAVGSDTVWAQDLRRRRLVAGDVRTRRVTRRLRLRAGFGPGEMAATDDVIWTLTANGLTGLDPDSGRVVRRVSRVHGPGALSLAGASLWTAAPEAGQVAHLDARTGRVRARVRIEGAYDVAAVGDGAWVVTRAGEVIHLGPAGERLGSSTVGLRGTAVSVDGTTVWVGGQGKDARDNRVWRVDPRTARPAASFAVGDLPPGFVEAVGDEIWVVPEFGGDILIFDPADAA